MGLFFYFAYLGAAGRLPGAKRVPKDRAGVSGFIFRV